MFVAAFCSVTIGWVDEGGRRCIQARHSSLESQVSELGDSTASHEAAKASPARGGLGPSASTTDPQWLYLILATVGRMPQSNPMSGITLGSDKGHLRCSTHTHTRQVSLPCLCHVHVEGCQRPRQLCDRLDGQANGGCRPILRRPLK